MCTISIKFQSYFWQYNLTDIREKKKKRIDLFLLDILLKSLKFEQIFLNICLIAVAYYIPKKKSCDKMIIS